MVLIPQACHYTASGGKRAATKKIAKIKIRTIKYLDLNISAIERQKQAANLCSTDQISTATWPGQ